MTWTKTPPTRVGAYYWKHPECCNGVPILLDAYHQDGVLVLRGSEPIAPDEQGGEWAGPLVEVAEVEKAWDEGFLALTQDMETEWKHSRARRVVEGEEV